MRNDLMKTRPIFNEDAIKPGDVINIYKVIDFAEELPLYRTGIVSEVDFSMIKYGYYSSEDYEILTDYLLPSSIYWENTTDKQWEENDTLYIFEVIPVPQR